MSADLVISRRAFAGGLVFFGVGKPAFAQGFAGLSERAQGYAAVTPGRAFSFPADHGPHPEYRIEWWYVTANLADKDGNAYGTQWTLFRQAMTPGGAQAGWANQQIWMAHAAVTRADTHRTSETFARGGVGQASVEINPFRAWIDSWQMRGSDRTDPNTVAPLDLTASAKDFSYTLHLDAHHPLVLQGEDGYSRKSLREQASYYYSQPFLEVTGRLAIDDKSVDVTGQAWMDREWSSQPLASDQTGWDWFSLHLNESEKLMLFRLRQADGNNYRSGNWILSAGKPEQIASADIEMTPTTFTELEGRKIPIAWHVAIPRFALSIETVPLNAKSWMGTSFPYWEGPISFRGSHSGLGYLEMTGY